MWGNADESSLIRVNRVEASHEDVAEHEKVNWARTDTHIAVFAIIALCGTHDVVFRADLNPVVLDEQVEAGEEGVVASGHVHVTMLEPPNVLLGVPKDVSEKRIEKLFRDHEH